MCYNINTINKYFEVENVLLRTSMVKRNAGKGTPAKMLFKTALISQGGFSMKNLMSLF